MSSTLSQVPPDSPIASWKPDFYPAKLPAKDFLKHYATRLNAVEINYTFRQLPKASTLENWVTATPDGFRVRLQGAPADHAHLSG